MKNEKVFLFSIIGIIAVLLIISVVCIFTKSTNSDEPKPKTITTKYPMDSDYKSTDATVKIYSSKSYFDTWMNDISKNYKMSKYSDDINNPDFDRYNYVVITLQLIECNETVDDMTFEYGNNYFTAFYDIHRSCGLCAPYQYVVIKKVSKSINNVYTYYKYINNPQCDHSVAYKPIMYIYPKEDMDLTIKLGNTNAITHTYPKYKDSWYVHVTKDSNIYDYDTKRNYYALYWEAKDDFKPDMKTGFVVEGKDTIKLLEDKLEVLGLNEREINEFITYWIDKIEDNKYNYIYFRTTEEVNKIMPLEISKNPDTLIRVLVDIVPLEEKIEVEEQVLIPQVRNGYTIIEWGGNIHN